MLSAVGFIPVTMAFDDRTDEFDFWNLYGSALIGLAITFLLVAITEYYTGTRWKPVKDIAKASQTATRRTSSRGSPSVCRRRLCPCW